MKILVFSDSHGKYERMADVISRSKYDAVIFLGDGISDFDRVSLPERFISPDGKTVKEFDWMKEYDGARYVMSWEN